ncbi:MAG: hypothetical protein ACREYC_09870 [Gammaproteobacteria bacterium]
MKRTIGLMSAMLWLMQPVWAVEVAPRISDREIIEALTELKAGQQALKENIEERFKAVDQRFAALEENMDQRFAAVDQRFAAVDQRFAGLEQSIDQRFAALEQSMDQRFAAVDQQLNQIWGLQLVLIGGVFGLIGFVMWDRYSTLRPLDERLRRIEEDLERDLELRNAEGSRLTRMLHALRELAKTDERVAAVLRNFSLL